MHHPDVGEMRLSLVMHALSDPVRLEIVRSLADGGEQTCSAFETPVAKSTLSHHFKVLREAGITLTRIEGTQRFISLRAEDLEARFPGLLGVVLRASDDC